MSDNENTIPAPETTVSIFNLVDPRNGQVRYVGSSAYPNTFLDRLLSQPKAPLKDWIFEAGMVDLQIVAVVPASGRMRAFTAELRKQRAAGAQLLNTRRGPRQKPAAAEPAVAAE